MFDRFSDGARVAVVHAQEEARLLGHTWIGTEHLLLSLTRGEAGAVSDVLVAHGLTPPETRAAVRDIVGAPGPEPSGHVPFTPRAKQVLERSLRKALEREDTTITPVHLLLSLLDDEDEGVAAQVIDRVADDRDALRRDVEALLDSADDDGPRVTVQGASFRGEVQQAVLLAAGPGGPPRPISGPQCAFCGREEARVDRVVVARGTILCSECIAAAAAMLDDTAQVGSSGSRVRFRRRGAEPDDPTEAREAIERAFEAVFPGGARERPDARWAAEDYDGVESDLAAMADGNRNSPMVVVDVTVERVEFIEPTMADVGLGIWLSGNTQPMVMPARSVLVDGVWKVSRETVAHFAQQARMFLGPRGPFGR
jgi:ATP-dependent Clp protease ATP-binding subunit ClpC